MSICTSCSLEQPEGARFCFGCGATLAAPVCGTCGEQLVAGARFCSSCGTVQGDHVAPVVVAQPVSTRRVTSILFGDLVGFTSLSEVRDQEEVRELLTRYFDEARRIVGRYGGIVEKFIGDAVMAVWGVPVAHEDDAERAVRAGLELVQKVAAFGEELGVADLSMRVGIVTGEVAVTIGAENQGMVAGDAVNTAARVQTSAEPGQVWVDETTRLLTSSAITYVDVGSHQMKGKVDPVPLWSVRAVVSAIGGSQRADGLEAPLVGRGRELRLVKELFHATEESGRAALLVIDGESGVGKTRLGWEFEKYVDGLTGTTAWHSGRCLAYGDGVAFYALAEAVRGRLRASLPEGPDRDEERLGTLLDEGLERYVSDVGERDWMRPRVEALLGIGSIGTFPREDLFSAWVTFFERVGRGQNPVALMIDDAQHADEGLLAFVEHLLSVGSFPCFVVLLTRPGLIEEHPALATNRRATVVHLPYLAGTDMALLLDGLVAGLPDEVRARLVVRSEGVPLFAVETVRSLIDRDLVVPRGGQYVLADAGALDLDTVGAPASLQALIAARLDTLGSEQRHVVDQASVLGNSFHREALAALCSFTPDLDEVLAGLVRQQLFSQESSRLSPEFGQFKFVQSVVRQVAYGTLSRRDRKAAHLAVVAQLRSEEGAEGEIAAVLAQHYLDAIEAVPTDPDIDDLQQAAAGYLCRAAARAQALGAPGEASAHLVTALELTTQPAARGHIANDLASALFHAGDYQGTVERATEAMETLERCGDRLGAGLAAATKCRALGQGLGENEQAIAVAEPWWEELRERTDAPETVMSLAQALSAARDRLSLDCRELDETRLSLAEQSGNMGELADTYTALSVTYASKGIISMSRVLTRAAADLARQHHLPMSLARTLVNLSATEHSNDLDKAIEYGREGIAVAAAAGSSMFSSIGRVNVLLCLWARGDWADATALGAEIEKHGDDLNLIGWVSVAELMRVARGESSAVHSTSEQAAPTDDISDQGWADLWASLIAHREGDLPGACRLALAATQALWTAYGLWDDLVHAWPVAVDFALEAADDAALARLMEMLDGQIHAATPRGITAHWRHAKARLAIRSGDSDEVEQLLRAAIADYTAWGARPFRALAEADLGVWLSRQQRPLEAEPLLASARDVLTELGATAWLEQLDSRLVAAH